jgi:hypothetical protein
LTVHSAQEKDMDSKPLMIAGAVVFSTAAFAQTTTQTTNPPPPSQSQMQPQTPANGKPNAQGEIPKSDRTMQEKDTGLMNQSGGVPGATGSTGTQSGTTPNTNTK